MCDKNGILNMCINPQNGKSVCNLNDAIFNNFFTGVNGFSLKFTVSPENFSLFGVSGNGAIIINYVT
jgi:hypothetical protein